MQRRESTSSISCFLYFAFLLFSLGHHSHLVLGEPAIQNLPSPYLSSTGPQQDQCLAFASASTLAEDAVYEFFVSTSLNTGFVLDGNCTISSFNIDNAQLVWSTPLPVVYYDCQSNTVNGVFDAIRNTLIFYYFPWNVVGYNALNGDLLFSTSLVHGENERSITQMTYLDFNSQHSLMYLGDSSWNFSVIAINTTNGEVVSENAVIMDVNEVSDLWNILGQSFDTSFVLLLQQYSEWNYSAWGLDPVTLELHWHVPLTQLNNPQSMTWLSDSENFYGLDFQGGQILAYTSSNGSIIWRAGLPTPPNDGGELEQYTFAWDYGNPTTLWIFNGSELASIVPSQSSAGNVALKTYTLAGSTGPGPSPFLVGIDLNSNIYFVQGANLLKTDNQANVVLTIDIETLVDNAVGGTGSGSGYNDAFAYHFFEQRQKHSRGKTSTLVRREVEGGGEEEGVHDFSSSEIPTYFIGLVPSGVFSMKTKTVVSVQCVVGTNYWDLASEVSTGAIIFSLIVNFLLMLKHRFAGEDPKGWNARKIPEVIVLVITVASVILVALLTSVSQSNIDNKIQESTQIFDQTFLQFTDEALQPCPSYSNRSSMAQSLCFCSDSGDFSTTQCNSALCSGVEVGNCESFLSSSCDCSDAILGWTCNCPLNLNGTCSYDKTAGTGNTGALNMWSVCQQKYSKSTTYITASYWFNIGASGLLVILSLGSLLTKFDNEKYETFCTIISLACTIVGAILPSLSQNVFDEGDSADGSASDSGAPDGTCIESLLTYLPGCVLSNTALLVTEEQARTYLRYALLNLVSSPMMFFISALPDLLTICGCCRCKKGGYEAL